MIVPNVVDVYNQTKINSGSNDDSNDDPEEYFMVLLSVLQYSESSVAYETVLPLPFRSTEDEWELHPNVVNPS